MLGGWWAGCSLHLPALPASTCRLPAGRQGRQGQAGVRQGMLEYCLVFFKSAFLYFYRNIEIKI